MRAQVYISKVHTPALHSTLLLHRLLIILHRISMAKLTSFSPLLRFVVAFISTDPSSPPLSLELSLLRSLPPSSSPLGLLLSPSRDSRTLPLKRWRLRGLWSRRWVLRASTMDESERCVFSPSSSSSSSFLQTSYLVKYLPVTLADSSSILYFRAPVFTSAASPQVSVDASSSRALDAPFALLPQRSRQQQPPETIRRCPLPSLPGRASMSLPSEQGSDGEEESSPSAAKRRKQVRSRASPSRFEHA